MSDGVQFQSTHHDRRTHVQATGNTGTGKRLVSSVFGTDGHKTRHLNLGELDLAAAKGSERLLLLVSDEFRRSVHIPMPLYSTYDIGDLERVGGSGHFV